MDRPLRVLIVEDSESDAEIDVIALESAGLRVDATRVETEPEYRAALDAESMPDVILSDHSMPTFDAMRALDILRERDADIPFLIVSGQIGEYAAVEIMRAGASDYVMKGRLARLAPAVRRELEEAANRRAARAARGKLAEHERQLETLMQNLPGMVYRLYLAVDGWRFAFASDGAALVTGHAPEQLTRESGMLLADMLDPGHQAQVRDDILTSIEAGGGFTLEHRIRAADGGQRWVWNRGTGVFAEDGRLLSIEGFAADITAHKADQARLQYLAHHDVLTGLANRPLFEDHLDRSLSRARRYGGTVSLLFIDLDNFKEINDSWGHATGDRVLQAVAERLVGYNRTSDLIARLGGDEFAIVLDGRETAEDAAQFARRLLDELAEPFTVDDKQAMVTASIGIAVFPQDGDDVSTLLKNADAAMYSAKDTGRAAYHFYTPDMNVRAHQMVALRAAVPKAIAQGELELHFHPQLDLMHRNLDCVEALVRWNHPHSGFLVAGEFIPLAEETGMISAIDEWVVRAAFRQARLWRDGGVPFNRIAVNLSARQFRNPMVVSLLKANAAEFGVDLSCMEVEITETVMMQDVRTAHAILSDIAELGVTLTVDDFGKGYSSLNYLKRLPIDRLKIDRDFVSGVPANHDDVQICRAILAFAASMELDVVAEGIETEEQARFLRDEGCRVGQGYLFARPMSAAHGSAYLRELAGIRR